MDHIEHPSELLWQERREWFETLFDVEKRRGEYLIGEQALGLVIDLQTAYCAGAFIACVILGCTIIDAHIREAEAGPDFEGGLAAAFQLSKFRVELEWLRQRRNQLVHFKLSRPALSVDDHYDH
ncbi:MAG: hypothetical protein JSS38_11325 [Nitrospira sp.]|nr:hypothetical protein [Nitrospira sp.]